MKRKLLLLVLTLAALVSKSQTYQQTNLELDLEIPPDKNCVFEASTSIKLLSGLHCSPNSDKSVMFSIDRYGVFPPDEGYLGGPSPTNNDGVVGALPGELKVNEFGAGIYSIPILMPQGIGKMTPEIAVTYNNQMGNGLLGWGWNLSGLSSITRTGRTPYHDGGQTSVNFVYDRFSMDGKRLMLCSGNYGGNGAVYKTEIDEMSKIVSFTDGYNGPARFVVYKKDGTVWEYGGTDDSRIEPQNDNNVVMTWLVNKISDPDGNSIVFQYVENQQTGEFYIKRIDYTLNVDAGVNSMYRVNFIYADRDDVESGYISGNIVQIKKILKNITIKNMATGAVLYDYSFDYYEPGNYSDNQKFMYNRLKSVGLVANGMKINPTIISWNKKNEHYPDNFQSFTLSQSIFNKVPFVGDFNGDGFSDVLTVPYKIGNTYPNNVQASIYLNNGDGSFNENPFYTFGFDSKLEWVYVVDFDGDGLDDVVPYYSNNDENSSWKSKIKIYLNRGNAFTYIDEISRSRYFTIYPGDFCAERKVSFILDCNNEGQSAIYYPHIVYFKDNGVVDQTLGVESYDYVPKRMVVEDFDADGSSEIMYLTENTSAVAKLYHIDNQYHISWQYEDGNFDCDDYIFSGDFNGDGYTDFLKYDNKTYWKLAFSDGKRLKTPVSCLNNSLLKGLTLAPQDRYFCSLEDLSKPSVTIRTADFDGDGKTDVAVFKNTGGIYYMDVGFRMQATANNTCSFGDIKRFYLNIHHSHQYVHIGNFLGRENVSVLGSVKTNPYYSEVPKIVSLNPQSSKYSVERITDGLGNSRGFKYEYLTPKNSFYSFDYKWVGDDVRTVSIPVRALYSDTVFTTNGNPCVTKYSYENALYHAKGHGLIGFEKTKNEHYINGTSVEKNVIENDVEIIENGFIAVPTTLLKYCNDNQLVARTEFLYDKYKCSKNEKVFMPLMTCKKTHNYDYDTPGSVLRIDIENIEYQGDMAGKVYNDVLNVKKNIVGVDENYNGDDASSCKYWEETCFEYNNKPGNWVVSRVKNKKYSKHFDDKDPVGSCEIYSYSGNNPYQITKTVSLPNTDMNYADPLKTTTEYSYDALGHVIMQSTVSPSSKSQKTIRMTYGEEYNYRYPTAYINENGWETHSTYDNNYGSLLSVLDYNQFETASQTDPFEITIEKFLPDGLKCVKTKRWARGNKHSPNNATYYCWEKTTGIAEEMTFFNKNGMILREVTFGLNGEPVYTDISYDDNGNVVSKTLPYFAGENVNTIYFVYDNFNRLREEVYPNGLVKSYNYNKFQTTISSSSPDGTMRNVIETVNPMGWRVTTTDIGGNTIKYDYYSDGKLKSAMIGDNLATKIEYEYDNRRNMSKMKDPACGDVSYYYNAFDELITMTTPKHGVISYNYDMMGNSVCRVESYENGNDAVTTQWVYDNKKGKIGTLSQIIYGDSQTIDYEYDDLLRLTNARETINGDIYTTNYTYNNAGQEKIVTYPTGFAVEKQYSNTGFYKSMLNADDKTVLWRSDKANAMGYISDYQVGNDLKTQRKYDDKTNLLEGIVTKNGNVVCQNITYSYDVFGNLVNRTKKLGMNKSESFTYDGFNRLVEIKLNSLTTGEMAYDNYGNILSKNTEGLDVFYDAHYDDNNPYSVTRAKTDVDDDAFLTQIIEYTPFDKMSRIRCGKNSYTIDYGYDYERIHTVEKTETGTKEKVYVGDCEYVKDKGTEFAYTYLNGPMGVFAVCCTDSNGASKVFYIHKDHLESWCLITDENGNVVQKTSYDAWGNPRSDDKWSGNYDGELMCDRGFTGHEHVSAFGFINMNGRAYDPMMSMMMSPDDYVQIPDFSQNYNRYIYCYNNPLSYYDPSGEWVEWLMYGVFNGVVNVICNMDYINSFEEGALSFGAGFVGGCLTQGLSECSWALQVFGNVSAATLKTGVNNFVKQNTGSGLDWSILENASFKSDVMYSLGSSLAKSTLTAYIKQPTDNEKGVNLLSKMTDNEVSKSLIEVSAGKIAGNLFSGKKAFDGFGCKSLNDYMPYAKCAFEVVGNQMEFEGQSKTLGSFFEKLLNFDAQGFMSKFGGDMNYCYSQIRSLFLKKG